MSERRGRPPSAEFSDETKLEALRRSEWKCERCGKTKKEVGYLEIHHKLGIAIALRYHPEISHALLSSISNASTLCPKCHDIRDVDDRKKHDQYARDLEQHERAERILTHIS